MKIKGIISIALMGLSFISCSDKDNDNPECDGRDIGFLKVTIPSSELRTAFTFTKVGSSEPFEEIVAPRTTTKTLEVKSGSYIVSVDQINSNGQAVTTPQNYNVEIEDCETTERTVTFRE